jgi:hypothetical protein
MSFVKDVKSVGGLVGKGCILAPPAISLLTSFGPPWVSQSGTSTSSSVGLSFVTSLVEVGVLILVFQEGRSLSIPRLKRWTRYAAVLVALTLVAYLIIQVVFVRDMPDSQHRDLTGFYYTPEARSTITSQYTEQRALRGAGYDPTRIWVPWTVYVMRTTTVVTWLILFSSVAALFGTFVVMERRVHAGP